MTEIRIRITGISIKHSFHPWIVIEAEDVASIQRQKYTFPVDENRVFDILEAVSELRQAKRLIDIGDIVTFPGLEKVNE